MQTSLEQQPQLQADAASSAAAAASSFNILGRALPAAGSCYDSPILVQPYRDDFTPKVQYLSPTCMLLTYYDGDIATLLDSHFQRSLSPDMRTVWESNYNAKKLPPSYYNRRLHDRSKGFAQPNRFASTLDHHPPSYSAYSAENYQLPTLLRQPPPMWSTYAASTPSGAMQRDFYASFPGAVSREPPRTSGPFFGLPDTKPHMNKLLPPAAHTLRTDWSQAYAGTSRDYFYT